MQAVAAEMARDDKGRSWFDRERGVTHTPGRIAAGGNVSLKAGGEIGIAGVDVTAGGGIDLMAANGILIAAVTDTHAREAEAKGKGGLFGTPSNANRGVAPVFCDSTCRHLPCAEWAIDGQVVR